MHSFLVAIIGVLWKVVVELLLQSRNVDNSRIAQYYNSLKKHEYREQPRYKQRIQEMRDVNDLVQSCPHSVGIDAVELHSYV